MKILFIGSRLYDDVDYYVRKKGIESILTESNEDAINLDLPDQVFIVPRGMDGPKQIAVTQNVDAVLLKRKRQVVGDLAADTHHYSERTFDRTDFQDGLEAELVKVKAVATVVVGGDGFRVVVDHHGLPSLAAEGVHGVDPAPVEFNAAADAVSP